MPTTDPTPDKPRQRTPEEHAAYLEQKLMEVYAERTYAQDELDRVNAALHDAGIDYPTGARGVHCLAQQRDTWPDRAADMVVGERNRLVGELERRAATAEQRRDSVMAGHLRGAARILRQADHV